MASDDKYLFYGHSKKKGVYPQGWVFSNFSPHPVVAYGIKWPTSEHLFQALKFKGSDDEYFNEIAKAKTPAMAKRLGRSRKHPLRDDWEEVKDEVMYFIIHAKATQNSEVLDELLATGKREIVENSPSDAYWGCGKDGEGRNQLGKALMQVRDDLTSGRNSPVPNRGE